MLPPVHLHPINVVVFNDPKKSNLVAGFVLRCFQHLSNPDLDTRRVCSENMKETNKEILKKALQIVKK